MPTQLPESPDALFKLAAESYHANRFAEAEALARRILAVAPRHADALHLLGILASRFGKPELGLQLLAQAIAIDPGADAFRNSLGLALHEQRRFELAIQALLDAIQLNPQSAVAHYNLGNSLAALCRYEEAIAAFDGAIRLNPAYPDALNNRGICLKELRRYTAACEAYEAALALDPTLCHARNNLGVVLKEIGRLVEAGAHLREALERAPDDSDLHNNLGNVFKEQGRVDDAIACYRRAQELSPDDAQIASNLVYMFQFVTGYGDGELRAEAARWNDRFAAALTRSAAPHANDRDPERRLKVGYVSADFRDHAESFFVIPLFEAHDREQIELHLYSASRRQDGLTDRIRATAHGWHDARTATCEELAERVREDGIDVLIDLTMHSGENRLLAFARKPAPVQLSWLAYPGRTGLEAIDFRITDQWMEDLAREEDAAFEQPLVLPHSWCCYEAIGDYPEPAAAPFVKNGYVTFGSLNAACKMNEPLAAVWSRVLMATPRSRLLMSCGEGPGREHFHRIFEANGISRDRVEFVGRTHWQGYMRLFQRCDIALDPYPCNAMTTTCHALYMGVPVVTRRGGMPVSRAGYSILSTVGLPELAAASEAEYIRIASELAEDRDRLAALHGTLRSRMIASPLMDAPGFARNMEAAFRKVWRQWCG